MKMLAITEEIDVYRNDPNKGSPLIARGLAPSEAQCPRQWDPVNYQTTL